MSSSIVTSDTLSRNCSFLSVGQVAQRFDVHPNTIRKHADSGTLRTYRINGGHRRFSEDDVLTWLGLSVERTDETGVAPSANTTPLALVARVSSDKQSRKSGENADGSSLDHQIDRVESFAREKWGLEPVKRAGKYYETGSGLNFERARLIALVNDVLAGKYIRMEGLAKCSKACIEACLQPHETRSMWQPNDDRQIDRRNWRRL